MGEDEGWIRQSYKPIHAIRIRGTPRNPNAGWEDFDQELAHGVQRKRFAVDRETGEVKPMRWETFKRDEYDFSALASATGWAYGSVPVCKVCGLAVNPWQRIHIHHITYEPERVTPLHARCHMKIHRLVKP